MSSYMLSAKSKINVPTTVSKCYSCKKKLEDKVLP